MRKISLSGVQALKVLSVPIPAIALFGLFVAAASAGTFDPRGAGPTKKFQIDSSASKLEVRVFKEGFLSAFGHNHEIAATRFSGVAEIDSQHLENSSVELAVDAASLKVRDQGISEKDRQGIQQDMLSVKVLDVQRHPTITFRSTGVSRVEKNNNAITVELSGDLTLHGVTRRHTVRLSLVLGKNELRASGSTHLKQTDYGITPIKVALGGVKVKDQVRISFELTGRAATHPENEDL